MLLHGPFHFHFYFGSDWSVDGRSEITSDEIEMIDSDDPDNGRRHVVKNGVSYFADVIVAAAMSNHYGDRRAIGYVAERMKQKNQRGKRLQPVLVFLQRRRPRRVTTWKRCKAPPLAYLSQILDAVGRKCSMGKSQVKLTAMQLIAVQLIGAPVFNIIIPWFGLIGSRFLPQT